MSNLMLIDVYSYYFEAGTDVANRPAPVPSAVAVNFLYDLMKERDPEINISHSTLPPFIEHWEYVKSCPYRCWYLIGVKKDGHPILVGSVSATNRNEIGIVLRQNARGKGYGPEAIRQLMARHDPLPAIPGERNGHWLANIAPGNLHSQHVFQKMGFRPIQITYQYDPPQQEAGQ